MPPCECVPERAVVIPSKDLLRLSLCLLLFTQVWRLYPARDTSMTSWQTEASPLQLDLVGARSSGDSSTPRVVSAHHLVVEALMLA